MFYHLALQVLLNYMKNVNHKVNLKTQKKITRLLLLMLLLLNTGKLLKAQAPPSGLISNPLLLVNQQLRDLFTPLYRPALI